MLLIYLRTHGHGFTGARVVGLIEGDELLLSPIAEPKLCQIEFLLRLEVPLEDLEAFSEEHSENPLFLGLQPKLRG